MSCNADHPMPSLALKTKENQTGCLKGGVPWEKKHNDRRGTFSVQTKERI